MALPTHYWLHLMVINEHIHKHNVPFVQHRDHTKQMLKRLLVSPTNGGVSVRITSLCWSYLLMKFIWGVRERLDAVMFCSDVAVCSYVRFHQMDIQRFLDVWARVCGDIMFFCSIALSDYIGYMYSSCYSSCRRLKKNLVKKCKTCCFFCFFILDEVWVALTPSWKFKQTCNTAHTRKKNSIHSFNSLFCDTFTSKHCGENF